MIFVVKKTLLFLLMFSVVLTGCQTKPEKTSSESNTLSEWEKSTLTYLNDYKIKNKQGSYYYTLNSNKEKDLYATRWMLKINNLLTDTNQIDITSIKLNWLKQVEDHGEFDFYQDIPNLIDSQMALDVMVTLNKEIDNKKYVDYILSLRDNKTGLFSFSKDTEVSILATKEALKTLNLIGYNITNLKKTHDTITVEFNKLEEINLNNKQSLEKLAVVEATSFFKNNEEVNKKINLILSKSIEKLNSDETLSNETLSLSRLKQLYDVYSISEALELNLQNNQLRNWVEENINKANISFNGQLDPQGYYQLLSLSNFLDFNNHDLFEDAKFLLNKYHVNNGWRQTFDGDVNIEATYYILDIQNKFNVNLNLEDLNSRLYSDMKINDIRSYYYYLLTKQFGIEIKNVKEKYSLNEIKKQPDWYANSLKVKKEEPEREIKQLLIKELTSMFSNENYKNANLITIFRYSEALNYLDEDWYKDNKKLYKKVLNNFNKKDNGYGLTFKTTQSDVPGCYAAYFISKKSENLKEFDENACKKVINKNKSAKGGSSPIPTEPINLQATWFSINYQNGADN